LLNNLDFESIIDINGVSIDITSVTYNPDDGTISVNIDYTADIQGQELTVNFDPGNTNDTAHIKQNATSLKLAVTPENNMLAIYYGPQEYNLADVTKYATMAIAGLFILLFLAAIVTGKIIGVEAMAVAQFAFISLMVIENQSPIFNAFKAGLLVCIYVPFLGEGDPSLNTESAHHVRGIDLYSKMSYNFSIDMIIIFVPILIGLVLLILSKTALKKYS